MTTKSKDVELSDDIQFIETPAPAPPKFETGESCGVALTNVNSSLPIAGILPTCPKPC